jgi:hypothetical protein
LILDQLILYRSLKLVEEIYDESMYGDPDIYRIKDIVHSVDINHWRSKQWLVDMFSQVYGFESGKVFVAGGWYGLLSFLLRKRYPNKSFNIVSADMDPKCETFGYKLFPDQDIQFQTMDVVKTDQTFDDCTAIICTSCEHIDKDDLAFFISGKPENAWLILQTNNYKDLASHVNCSESLEEFVDFVSKVLPSDTYWAYKGALNLGDFTRYMVIVR